MGLFYKYLPLKKSLTVCLLIAFSYSAFSQAKVGTDSVRLAIEPGYDSVSSFHRAIFGEAWRKLWASPVTLPIFHLDKERGGLKILQKGGGMQTKSLRLQDSSGQEWVIRTIQKYPEKTLPPTLRKSVAADILQDQIAAEHPFSALIVPPLADALGIPHAHPKIVFMPDDPALGQYRKDFANQVFLFEEREPLDASKSDNTDKTQEKLQDDNDNRVDQKTVLRARLLDMLMGDWDRHEDQWRFERQKDDQGINYEPVPRDRDQVFYKTTGALPWLVSRYLLMAKLQGYSDHIRSINRWNLNARNFDRYFLTGLNQQDWENAIAEVQSKISDDLITRSVKLMPANIYQLCGPELVADMIHRRNILKEQALHYYRFLSSVVSVPGSDKREYIDITNQPSGAVEVKINKLKKDGTKDHLMYNRTFDPSVTKEIRIYAQGGDDIFAVHGEDHTPITVRMIGGDDEDTYVIDSNITSKGNRYVYDRSDKKNDLPANGAHIRTAADTMVNNFNKKNFKYDYLQPLPLISYNRDYGVELIARFAYVKQGFRKEPYASKQTLGISYGFGASSLLVNYTGEFKQAIGNTDIVIDALNKGPNYTSYFFGVGNNSVFVNSGMQQSRYYRNIYNYLSSDFKLRHAYGDWTVSAGIGSQFYSGDADDNQNKYLNVYNNQHPDEHVYANQGYFGGLATVTLDTRDKSIVPHKGVYWNTSFTGMKGLNNRSDSYGQIQSELGFYLTPGTDSTFIVADRIGGGTTFGNAAFYQQLRLGGNQNLRGYYSWRFTGKSMAFNNFEVRVKLADVNSYLLPGTLGLIGFHDMGRVWAPGENSSEIHMGYGGGFFFLPGELILVQGVVGFSKEGVYPYVSAGFRF